MTKVILTQDARDDILDIIAYTRDRFGQHRALKLRQTCNMALQSLKEQPLTKLAEFSIHSGTLGWRWIASSP